MTERSITNENGSGKTLHPGIFAHAITSCLTLVILDGSAPKITFTPFLLAKAPFSSQSASGCNLQIIPQPCLNSGH